MRPDVSSIAIGRVTRSAGERTILAGIDLDIASGAFVALLGPSGAGKTSLLRIIAGLDRPDSGSIAIGPGDDAGHTTRHIGGTDRCGHARIGFVFQRDALFPHMTAADNIGFGLRARTVPIPAAEIARRIADHLALVGMADFGDRLPGRLSGGQRQRVALARALAAEPDILLLDEPFGALDGDARRTLGAVLRRVHDARGLTTLLVTHDETEAAILADRIVHLRDGRIIPS